MTRKPELPPTSEPSFSATASQSKLPWRYEFIIWLYAEIEVGYQFQALAKRVAGLDSVTQELAIAAVYRALSSKTILLVFDNAETYAAIVPYLPPNEQTSLLHLLITSRETRQSEGSDIPVLPLPVFNLVETQQLLERRLGSQETALLKQLHDALGGLPLALSHVAAYMQAHACSLAHYLDLFRQGKTDVFAFQLVDDPHGQTVGVTVSLLLLQAAVVAPQSERVLDVIAYLNPDAIAVTVLAEFSQLPLVTVEAALNALQRYALIQRENMSPTQLPDEALEARAYAWAAISLADNLNGRYAAAKDATLQAQRLVPPALSTSSAMAFVLHQLGNVEYRQGDFEAAKRYYQQALTMNQRTYGESHPDIAVTLRSLARVNFRVQTTSPAQQSTCRFL